MTTISTHHKTIFSRQIKEIQLLLDDAGVWYDIAERYDGTIDLELSLDIGQECIDDLNTEAECILG